MYSGLGFDGWHTADGWNAVVWYNIGLDIIILGILSIGLGSFRNILLQVWVSQGGTIKATNGVPLFGRRDRVIPVTSPTKVLSRSKDLNTDLFSILGLISKTKRLSSKVLWFVMWLIIRALPYLAFLLPIGVTAIHSLQVDPVTMHRMKLIEDGPKLFGLRGNRSISGLWINGDDRHLNKNLRISRKTKLFQKLGNSSLAILTPDVTGVSPKRCDLSCPISQHKIVNVSYLSDAPITIKRRLNYSSNAWEELTDMPKGQRMECMSYDDQHIFSLCVFDFENKTNIYSYKYSGGEGLKSSHECLQLTPISSVTFDEAKTAANLSLRSIVKFEKTWGHGTFPNKDPFLHDLMSYLVLAHVVFGEFTDDTDKYHCTTGHHGSLPLSKFEWWFTLGLFSLISIVISLPRWRFNPRYRGNMACLGSVTTCARILNSEMSGEFGTCNDNKRDSGLIGLSDSYEGFVHLGLVHQQGTKLCSRTIAGKMTLKEPS